ncbi:hypothetical protein D4764_04G0010910 [Takifugu flavidus]|uniref:Uncharacterized protein n=1 Tax=Takifugu flavidus TaxID=433684 RepID=A0A5C6N4Q5_9TELE|nr:hypothetical protein D4764_04G0010910 [Takifugu flavidus]
MAKGKVDTENRGFKQEQLEKKGKDFMASSLAVDESSDIRGDSSLNVTEEFLALRPVHGTTTGQDLYEEEWTGGQDTGEDAGGKLYAELTAHHCIIHLESLCAEALNMEHGMFTITHAGNFIRAKGLIQRQFKAFLSQWQTQRGDLPHHTEVQSIVERVIVFLLSRDVDRSLDETVCFSLHPRTESCSLLWGEQPLGHLEWSGLLAAWVWTRLVQSLT